MGLLISALRGYHASASFLSSHLGESVLVDAQILKKRLSLKLLGTLGSLSGEGHEEIILYAQPSNAFVKGHCDK